jgi:hypothetical protein
MKVDWTQLVEDIFGKFDMKVGDWTQLSEDIFGKFDMKV